MKRVVSGFTRKPNFARAGMRSLESYRERSSDRSAFSPHSRMRSQPLSWSPLFPTQSTVCVTPAGVKFG